jgi:hypothetical protein
VFALAMVVFAALRIALVTATMLVTASSLSALAPLLLSLV